ncbi:hydantoinase/oxoprolinase family protein [Actinocorallia sp. A-T 12471]|uniref:hydantoinase/oxoprolinase family protein n=1 Tax=Actinocorallia sp. A-T 12471 TaxID=3089813 RepID=UPI0029D15D8C|nr:hydantoinase/oxoprolinase family protein [Actinocorallia sp. A-T 12471]MDX6741466.1 hydantoinase/oxoprolinase family protein [Actinocorallia sp. A-T 12471]
MTTYRIGIDVGGTFTDCVLKRPDGSLLLEKAPTTPLDQSDGVMAGLEQLAAAEDMSLRDLLTGTLTIVHGTTTGDNTMIQMTGAPTGLLVTRGFRDEIEFRRCYKEDIWDPTLPAPEPIARRRVRLEIDERMTAEGEIDTPLDEEGVRKAVARLRAFGVTSIAVAFLHSYLNPRHERRARELILAEYPDVEMVSLSHEVHPKPPEFERTSTTLVNAYVGPPIARYLRRLTERLADNGYAHELLVATSAGGVATADAAARRAVATLGSGPTGGVSAAARHAAAAGLGDVVSVDMGGTSYDLCLIRDGRPDVKMDWNWFQRYCVGIPMVDIPSVGAGGGSIIWQEQGVLHVGPQSAQSTPGPVCYGRGGLEPTITDADLVLGRLDPAGFHGGRMELDVAGARAALADLGGRVGLDAEQVATAAVRLVDAHMTDAIRRVLSLAGADPRRFDLVAFGGMGGVHAATQARALGMKRVLIPRAAAGFSALGLLAADHVIDGSRGYLSPTAQADRGHLAELAADLEGSARAELRIANVPDERVRLEWSLLLVYPGQTFDTSIPVADPCEVEAAVAEFHRRNAEARLIEARAQEPLLRGIRLTAVGEVDRPADPELPESGVVGPVGHRRIWAGERWHDRVPVYAMESLMSGFVIDGPAAIGGTFTTVILAPGDRARPTPTGDLLIEVAG